MHKSFRMYGLPAILLTASVVTTTANGARFMQNFLEGMPPVVRDSDLWPWPWLMDHPELWILGWTFSFALLGILLTHEFGHYFACRAHKIKATLPWVLPAPTLSGTAGAVIQIRSRIPTRNALLDVGLYGPLMGYFASVAAIATGFLLSTSEPANAPAAIVRFGGEPLTIGLIHSLVSYFNPAVPGFDQIAPHPVLVAGWIGLFITSLNLIPGGQLDGGHILYAISPKLHKLFTNYLPLLLFIAGAVFWVGWILWGIFLMIPAMRHPRIPVQEDLSHGRAVLGLVGMAVFFLSFTPVPFYNSSLMHFLHPDPFTTTPH
ncbi:MAG: site-2 protease family protein [Terracidiphilus sp.]|nr:site-2 protease family protein [Terracidiphilus sp.]